MRARPVRFSDSTGLRLCGIADEPFWPSEKNSSASSTSVRCRWRISVASRSIDAATTPERRKEHRVPVARNDLGRHRLDREPHGLGDMRLHARIDLREGADRAGDRAGRHLLARRDQAFPGPGKFRIGDRELHAERRRLRMDAVRTPHGGCLLVLEGAALQRGEQPVDVADQNVGGAGELHVETGVEHVRRRHARMHEARLGADDLAEMGEERDHVVLGDALDLVDPRNVELGVLALVPDFLRRGLRHDAELGHGVGRVRLDLEPDAEPRLRRPDRNHFGTGITRDHRGLGRGGSSPSVSNPQAAIASRNGGKVGSGRPLRQPYRFVLRRLALPRLTLP